MELLKTSDNLTKAEAYKLTHSQAGIKMSSMSDKDINIREWAHYLDDDKELLSIMDTADVVMTTNSATFIKAFIDMVEYFDPEPVNIIHVVPGVSSNGREFITCDYVA